MNSDNSSSLAPEGLIISGTILSVIELVVHPISLLISLFNFLLIFKTAILHSNLKWILLAQSIGIGMHQIARTAYVAIKFWHADMFFKGPIWIQMLGLFGITFRNLISHVLITERTLATIKFHTYGQSKGIGFTFSWLSLLIVISAWITFSQHGSPWSVSLETMISICIVFGVGLAEIFAMFLLYKQNVKRYRTNRTGVVLSLDEKYQLCENIRTARQLAPTFVFHFLNGCVNNGMTFLIFFGVVQQSYTISWGFIIGALINGVASALIEWTVITHHPILKRKAKLWLDDLCRIRCCQIRSRNLRISDPIGALDSMTSAGDQPRNIYGKHLLDRSERDNHFRMLHEWWRR